MSQFNGPPYVGRSSEEEAEPTLENAIRNAYKKGRHGKPDGPMTFRISEIRVEGNNPISDYIVHLDEPG